MRSALSSGTRDQYTQPPNGSLNGTPSRSTSVRLTPLGPIPRSDTPCVVGCDARLLVRRNRLNVGICRSTSSATIAGDCLMSSRSSMAHARGHIAGPALAPRRRHGDGFRDGRGHDHDVEVRRGRARGDRLPQLGETGSADDDQPPRRRRARPP